ncbi:uncharacterized protein LOC142978654 [Anticarsia gemmatalis]|uniref:uncharacterized protein LOC142978654 n=1 Tax=Anticarsia gemmatalis TaxID=129554 RepID=UPI003F75E846
MKELYLFVLLLVACAYAPASSLFVNATDEITTVEPPAPVSRSFKAAKEVLDRAAKKIEAHVTSIADSGPPQLEDHRRHYAQIFYVLLTEAEACLQHPLPPHGLGYQERINLSAPKGLSSPHEAVVETQQFLDEFNNRTRKIQTLINDLCSKYDDCDHKIEAKAGERILENDIAREARVLFPGAKAAKLFLKIHSGILLASDKLQGLNYVVTGEKALKNAAQALCELLRAMRIVPYSF